MKDQGPFHQSGSLFPPWLVPLPPSRCPSLRAWGPSHWSRCPLLPLGPNQVTAKKKSFLHLISVTLVCFECHRLLNHKSHKQVARLWGHCSVNRALMSHSRPPPVVFVYHHGGRMPGLSVSASFATLVAPPLDQFETNPQLVEVFSRPIWTVAENFWCLWLWWDDDETSVLDEVNF